MASYGEVSKSHTHKDGTKGWDINIKDDRGRVQHKMHVSDQSGVGEAAVGILSGIAKAAGSVFSAIFGSKK